MKNHLHLLNFLFVVVSTLIPSTIFAGLNNMSVETMVKKYYTKESFDNFVGGTTFSLEDKDAPTGYDIFKIGDVYKCGVDLSFKNYTEGGLNAFNGAGSGSRQYAIVLNPKTLNSKFRDLSSDATVVYNMLVFHSPKQDEDCLTMKVGGYRPGTPVNVNFYIEEVSGSTSNKSATIKVFFNGESQGNVTLSGIQRRKTVNFTIDADKLTGSEFSLVLKRTSENGNDYVFAISRIAVFGTPNALTAMGSNLSASYGTTTTLQATFSSAIQESDLIWKSSDDGVTFTDIASGTGKQKLVVTPPVGRQYYRVEAKGYVSNSILTTRNVVCGGHRNILWEENFGNLSTPESRNSYQYVTNRYSYKSTGNVSDGGYAVVSNPRTAGKDDGTAEKDYWFRNITDHTNTAPAGQYGGMLLINCGDGTSGKDVVVERQVSLGCKNVFVNFSVWFANAGWNRDSSYDNHPIDMVVCVLSPSKDTLAKVEVKATKEESWKNGTVSFYNKDYDSQNLTLQIINFGASGGGNDVLIDDITFETCRPDVSLSAYEGSGQPIESISDIQLDCNVPVVFKVDENDSYIKDFSIPCPYYKWMISTDGKNWSAAGYEGACNNPAPDFSIKEYTITTGMPRKYYKCIIGETKDMVDNYIADPAGYACSNVVETPVASVRCPRTGNVYWSQTDCNKYKCTFDDANTNDAYWYYGSDDCGWNQFKDDSGAAIIGMNDVEVEITADMIPASNCQLYIKAVDTDNADKFAIADTPVTFKELGLKAKINEAETSGCDIVFDVVAEYKENGYVTPASIYRFTDASGDEIQATPSNAYKAKPANIKTNYGVSVGLCSNKVDVDATCPQMIVDSVCNKYTLTMTGWQGGAVTWEYLTADGWKPINSSLAPKSTKCVIDDVSELFPKGTTTAFKVRVKEEDAIVERTLTVHNLSLDAAQIGSGVCDKEFTLTANLLTDYNPGTSDSYKFYKYQSDGTWLDLPGTVSPTYSTGVLSKATRFRVVSEGCEADTLLTAGCPQLSYTYTCNDYTFVADKYQGTPLVWEYGNDAKWNLIDGESDLECTVDVAKLFGPDFEGAKQIKVTDATGNSDVIDVVVHSISIESDKYNLDFGESAVVTLCAEPNVGWLSVKGATLYDNKDGNYGTKKSDNTISWGLSPEYSARYFAKSGDGCVSDTIDIKVKPDILITKTDSACNIYSFSAVVRGTSDVIVWQKSTDGGTNWDNFDSGAQSKDNEFSEDTKIRAIVADTVSNVVNVIYRNISIKSDKSAILAGEESAEITATTIPANWLDGKSVMLYDITDTEQGASTNLKWTVSPKKNTTYYVKAEGCVSDSVSIDVIERKITWPTIFMPYSTSGNNVLFAPFYEEGNPPYTYLDKTQIDEIKIFDRTGNMVADVKGDYWDGTSADGKLVMPGVYYYVGSLIDNDTTFKGHVEVYKEK